MQDSTGALNKEPESTCGVTNGTARVGTYAPNSWGLYDMHGNVYEWCLDRYTENITGFGGSVNTTVGTTRVRRGGSWAAGASMCRAANRGGTDPSHRVSPAIGFRLALPASPAIKTK